MKKMKLYLLVAACLLAGRVLAAISVRDDAGTTIELQRPAQRVVTSASRAAEPVFTAGGGGQVAGAVNHGDFPPAASDIIPYSILRIGKLLSDDAAAARENRIVARNRRSERK